MGVSLLLTLCKRLLFEVPKMGVAQNILDTEEGTLEIGMGMYGTPLPLNVMIVICSSLVHESTNHHVLCLSLW